MNGVPDFFGALSEPGRLRQVLISSGSRDGNSLDEADCSTQRESRTRVPNDLPNETRDESFLAIGSAPRRGCEVELRRGARAGYVLAKCGTQRRRWYERTQTFQILPITPEAYLDAPLASTDRTRDGTPDALPNE